MRYISVDGVRLRVGLSGTGPPLLFLFGSGAAGTIENAQPLVQRFSPAFQVACPDQRGLGKSDIPPGPWTMADYATDAFGVADELGWDAFAIIGISFGGMVALEMAAQNSSRIDRMVLWGTSPGGAAPSYPLERLTDLPADERNRLFAQIMDTRLDSRWDQEGAPPEAQLVAAVLKHGGSPWSVAQGADEARREGLLRQLEARRGHDVTLRLGRITCPVLIGAGTYDGLAPVCNARVIYEGIAGSALRVYDAGHFFYLGRKAFSDGLEFLTGSFSPPADRFVIRSENARDRLV